MGYSGCDMASDELLLKLAVDVLSLPSTKQISNERGIVAWFKVLNRVEQLNLTTSKIVR
jgi:hypothetical protein